jgi:hypothetical protein
MNRESTIDVITLSIRRKDEYSADQLAVLNMKQHYHYPHQESVRPPLQPSSTGKVYSTKSCEFCNHPCNSEELIGLVQTLGN